ncbi:MAG: DedA family protein [Acetobacteraceae bacterium]|nr:DedA family protein [Acetobacteraceae bacterium]
MLEWLDTFVQHHGTWFVAVVIFVESMGMPVPGESMLIALSIYAATKGGIDIYAALGWAVVGAVMGDNAGYLLGKTVGRRALARWGGKIGLTEKRLILGEYLFDRHGGKVVFFARFIAFMRTFAALLAGAVHMPWLRFLLWNGLGGFCWVVGYGGAAYLIGDHIKAFLGPIGMGLGAVALGLIIWFVIWVNRHEDEMVAKAESELGKRRGAGRKGRGKPLKEAPAEGG